MNAEHFPLTGTDGLQLPAVIWQPEGTPKAILQITHGMTEHMGRYEALASELCSQGIAVAGFDLRGHGKNSGDPEIASFGLEGWAKTLEDMHLFSRELQLRFPECPRYMLGFSLGSFLLREYLGTHPDAAAGAIIAGTGHEPGWLLRILMALVAGEIKKSGFDGTTGLVRQLSFGTYNQKFRPNRTEADWLCSDEAALDQYLADPLVRKNISSGLFRELLGSMKRTGTREHYATWKKALPVLLLYGTDDPVGKSGKGVTHLYMLLKKAGLQDLVCRQFPNARHDIFHEEADGTAAAVHRCIGDWLAERI